MNYILFHANVSLLYPCKYSKTCFFGVFRGYRNRELAWNGFRILGTLKLKRFSRKSCHEDLQNHAFLPHHTHCYIKNWSNAIFGWWVLTLPVPIPDEEKKLSFTFIFTLLCGASKGFVKALNLKAFIKFFEAPKRSVKIKIQLNFLFQYNLQKCTGQEGSSLWRNLWTSLWEIKPNSKNKEVEWLFHTSQRSSPTTIFGCWHKRKKNVDQNLKLLVVL